MFKKFRKNSKDTELLIEKIYTFCSIKIRFEFEFGIYPFKSVLGKYNKI